LVVRLPAGAQLDNQQRLDGRLFTPETAGGPQAAAPAAGKPKGGKPAAPRSDLYYIPLVNRNSEDSFLLELRYTVPGSGSRLDCPAFPVEAEVQPAEPAIQKLYLCVYLPEEQLLLSEHGPWTEEIDWELGRRLRLHPRSDATIDGLLSWVAQNISLTDFPTERQAYVFWALNPSPPPQGSLHLRTWNETALDVAILAVVILLGLVLVPARATMRLMVVGAAAVVLIVIAALAPIFARQILSGSLALAVLVVLVIWGVWWVICRARCCALGSGGSSGPPAGRPVAPTPQPPPAVPPPTAPAAVAPTRQPPIQATLVGEPAVPVEAVEEPPIAAEPVDEAPVEAVAVEEPPGGQVPVEEIPEDEPADRGNRPRGREQGGPRHG